jgi:hypothetical protein
MARTLNETIFVSRYVSIGNVARHGIVVNVPASYWGGPTPQTWPNGKSKMKVKFSLRLTKHHAMKTYEGMKV